jgi:hypothetical protein
MAAMYRSCVAESMIINASMVLCREMITCVQILGHDYT